MVPSRHLLQLCHSFTGLHFIVIGPPPPHVYEKKVQGQGFFFTNTVADLHATPVCSGRVLCAFCMVPVATLSSRRGTAMPYHGSFPRSIPARCGTISLSAVKSTEYNIRILERPLSDEVQPQSVAACAIAPLTRVTNQRVCIVLFPTTPLHSLSVVGGTIKLKNMVISTPFPSLSSFLVLFFLIYI